MKVVSIIGARPQYIKAAVVSPLLRQYAKEVLIDTGQHYDEKLSKIFYDGLAVPRPDYDLRVGSATHGIQTGKMLMALDPILEKERPDWVVVYGDTNSTLAGALAASKLHIPVAHIEAGLRSFNRAMPEEINRVLTDHLATKLYCPTKQAVNNLAQEGITEGVVLCGDVMDVLWDNTPDNPEILVQLRLQSKPFALATVHRQETTDDPDKLRDVLKALADLPWPVVLPLHPRTRQRIEQFHLQAFIATSQLHIVEPLGYQDMVTLERHAQAVLTDSGGVQREACRAGTPTYILRDETEWTELIESGQAVLCGTHYERIRDAVQHQRLRSRPTSPSSDPVRCIVEDLQRGYDSHA
ncbi:MAG: UDP-N-acetylglucosamine 2-epimerase (non-hydrolyzing) [Sulfobacillus thermosulfidooxidans]|uniref:UDP-N-acetylglucosamine 2-epimerase (Non-hydrolyzing) n=1 Tax=Sulfobacillus thermosulfidooxidans TaxID=28034 RepID=A0A2T2X3B2_SULTH|nr:MAG: UDP-N-acetylglucosamine 2-epimerase (non-hydrolyzing) [Sulfobacillus thermosulfidooxidans]